MQNTQPNFDEIVIVRIPYWKLNVERSIRHTAGGQVLARLRRVGR